MKDFALIIVVVWVAIVVGGCSHRDLTIGNALINQDGSRSEWRLVSSKRGKFKIQMPAVPKETTNTISSPFGPITQYAVVAEPAGTIAYGVFYFDVPKSLQRVSFRDVVSFTRNAMIGSQDKLVGERDFKVDGRDVAEFVLEKLNGQARATIQMFFIGERNYSLVVVMPNKLFVSPENPKSPLIASNLTVRFFNSAEFQK